MTCQDTARRPEWLANLRTNRTLPVDRNRPSQMILDPIHHRRPLKSPFRRRPRRLLTRRLRPRTLPTHSHLPAVVLRSIGPAKFLTVGTI